MDMPVDMDAPSVRATAPHSFAVKAQLPLNGGSLKPLITMDELIVTRFKCGRKNLTIAPNPDWDKLVVCMAGKQSLKTRLNGEHAYSGKIDPWGVNIIPANSEETVSSSSSDAIGIFLHRNVLSRQICYRDGDDPNLDIRPRFNHTDPVIKVLAAELLLYHENINNNSLYAGSVAQFILNRLYSGRQPMAITNTLPTTTFPYALTTAIDYIHSEYRSEIRLENLAALANVSPYQLSQLFRTHLDTSPHKYLMKIRMDSAVKLLRSTSMSIDEIRLQTGHNSLQWFSTAFKNQFGLSPSKYRALI